MPTVSELLSQNVGNTITNSQTWNGVIYNVKAYGAKGDGSTDDAAKIADAINAASVNGGIVYFPPGTYVIGSALTFPSNVTSEFSNGAKLSINTGITVTMNGPIHAGLYQIFSGAGTVIGNIQTPFVYPQWWGAKGDNVADDTVAFTSAQNASSVVYVPSGTYKVTVSPDKNKVFGPGIVMVSGVDAKIYPSYRSLPLAGGIVTGQTQFNARTLFIDYNTTIPQSTIQVSRNIIGSGGTPSQIGNAISVSSIVASEVTSAEWAITSVLDSYANSVPGGSAGNVALVAQGNKYGSGPVWGSNIMARDMTGLASGVEGLFGLELNIAANEADTNLNRIGLYITGVRQLNQDALAEFSGAIKAVATVNTKFINGLWFQGSITTAINIESSGTTAIKSTGTNTYGIDLSGGTHTGAAIRIKSDEWIDLNPTANVRFKYNSTSGNIEFYYGATLIGHIVAVGGADHAL